jgi:hypothetical protein
MQLPGKLERSAFTIISDNALTDSIPVYLGNEAGIKMPYYMPATYIFQKTNPDDPTSTCSLNFLSKPCANRLRVLPQNQTNTDWYFLLYATLNVVLP